MALNQSVSQSLLSFGINFDNSIIFREKIRLSGCYLALCAINRVLKRALVAQCCNPKPWDAVMWMNADQVVVWLEPDRYKGDRDKVPERIY